jgi:hypothetical protein
MALQGLLVLRNARLIAAGVPQPPRPPQDRAATGG